MEGTLDTFGVVEMLQMLGRTKLSGTLHIECPHRLIDVRFVKGRIAATRDSTRVAMGSVIGRQLVERSLVEEAALTRALAEQEVRPRPLGTLLVESGAVSEGDLRDVLSRQIANTLVAARLETNGDFLFMTDHRPEEPDFITVDTHTVLLDISALGGEYCIAVERLGRSDTVLVRNTYQSAPPVPSPLQRDEALVLAQVDGRRTVRDIVALSGVEEITVISVLGRFVDAGVLLVKVGLDVGTETDAVLRAHRDTVLAEVSRLFVAKDEDRAEAAFGG